MYGMKEDPQEWRQGGRSASYETKLAFVGRTRHRASDLLHITQIMIILAGHAIHLLSQLWINIVRKKNCLVFLHRMMRRPISDITMSMHLRGFEDELSSPYYSPISS